jgi:hypothetical protein
MKQVVPVKLSAGNIAAGELLAYAKGNPVYTMLLESEMGSEIETNYFGIYSSAKDMGQWFKLFGALTEFTHSYEPKTPTFTRGSLTLNLEALHQQEREQFEKGLEGKFLE